MKWANTSKERKPLESLAWLLFAKLKEHEAQNWRRKARGDRRVGHFQFSKGHVEVKGCDCKCIDQMCMCLPCGKQYLSSPCCHLSLVLLVGPATEKTVFTRTWQVVELRPTMQCMTGGENTDHGAPSALLNMGYVWRWAHGSHWSTGAWLSGRSRWPRNSLTPFRSWSPYNQQHRLPARESLRDTSSARAAGTDYFLNHPMGLLP